MQLLRDWRCLHIGLAVATLTFWGHVRSSVTWPSDSAWALSYWWSMITMRLSWTGTEIRGFKDFEVTSLTFWGHVTSSVTWSFDSAWALSYWWSMMTVRLSCTDTEIRGFKDFVQVLWRHRSRDHSTRRMWFPIGGPLEPCVYLAPLRRYKATKLHLPMLKVKSSLRMLRVTWPISRGAKMTTYLEFQSLYCLFTIQLLWGYDDD